MTSHDYNNLNLAFDSRRYTILVVDDDTAHLGLLHSILETDYTVLVAEDGDTGLERAEYARPDLIILDIMMPTIDGLETCRRLKQSEETKDIPVIFLTALSAPEQKTMGLAVGAVDFIVKPFHLEEVLVRVALHIRLTETKKRLQASKNHLETVFSSLPDGLITVGRDSRILSFNAAAEQIYGPDCTLPPSCQRAISECISRRAPVTVHRHEYHPVGRQQSLAISITVSPLLTDDNDCYGAVVLTRDDTLLDELERAVTSKSGSKFVGDHSKIKEVHSAIADCAKVDTTVLILGDSGTGKELVASLIQEGSARRSKPFVKVNVAGLPDALIESELFGHVKGAFTGAHTDRIGRFELAEGGTIFLDEIGDISPQLQVRLLRVLENRSFERVGESIPRKIDVRVIAATNCNLEKKVMNGEFRQDLYYRLNVFAIEIPSLKDRTGDIPLLVEHFLHSFRHSFNKDVSISKECLDFLMSYPWPGNVRELRNALEYAVVRTKDPIITLNSLPANMVKRGLKQQNPAEVIRAALVATGGNKAKTARTLGMDRKTLYSRIKEYGLDDLKIPPASPFNIH